MLARGNKRHALFLQGTGSTFFAHLAEKLQDFGLKTSKIHLCIGDRVFWRGGNSVSYKGSFSDWQNFLSDYVLEFDVTDIILFSDSRPYHVVAVNVAKSLGVNVFVFENGYVRPNWITMEVDGVNGRSKFPSEPHQILKLCEQAARSTVEFAGGSPSKPLQLYFGDTTFHALNFAFKFVFPRYEGFRKIPALREAGGWIKKAFVRPWKVKRSQQALEKLFSGAGPVFFFPLQLEHDYQLKVDSPYETIEQASNEVIASFARHAPETARLLVKNHPLDNNTINREAQTLRLARKHAIQDRVVFVEVGHNPYILKRSAGMVTINSTMGTAALYHKVPMCVLGEAIYKVDGLVHQGGLDSFWQAPDELDNQFSLIFREALIYYCQVQGHFSESNIESGVFEHCVTKILGIGDALPCKSNESSDAERPSVLLGETHEKEGKDLQTG